jgi:glycosyltransferase involved in cell wall biosynthesis
MPKLTIITVNLNNADGLRKTLQSVTEQTYNDFEHIIIDGGSRDNSVELIEHYTERITYWVSEPDKGIYNAMNKGILQSKGEFLLFLNSGDWLVDRDVLLKAFKNDIKEDIVYGHIFKIGKNSDMTLHKAINSEDLSLLYFYYDTLPHPSTFFSRKIFHQSMYDEDLLIASDKKFFIENIIFKNCSVKQIDQVITCFNEDGISHNQKYASIVINENQRIITEFVPPRIDKDYKELLSLHHSPLKVPIMILLRTKKLQIILSLFMSFLLRMKHLFTSIK